MRSPAVISTGYATAMRLSYFILMTVHQDFDQSAMGAGAENGTVRQRPDQLFARDASATRIVSGTSVMMQSAPMATRIRATAGWLMV